VATYFVFLFVAGLGYTVVDLLLRRGSTLRSRVAFWAGLLSFGLLNVILHVLFPRRGLALGLSINLLAGAGYLVYRYLKDRRSPSRAAPL
jgi:drug/metabolite transporter (DMT)-like permease